MISGGGALDRYVAASKGLHPSDASTYGFCGMLGLLALAAAAVNAAMSRGVRVAAIAGAIFGGGYIFMVGIFSFAFREQVALGAMSLPIFALLGALLGAGVFQLTDQNRARLGLKDPSKDRMELLRQLHDLQATLTAGEQDVTFMSVDVVGSTRMKEQADPLTIEFSFGEYHRFVERIAAKYGGRIHSTAGDGVICAFESPIASFGAARNIQAEILEFNTLRNKLPVPITVRIGVHRGSVVAPRAGDPTSVNFAHVIDVAAHVEKACPPGGIAITEVAASSLIGGMNAIGQQRFECDGQTVVVWAPRSRKLSGISET
jgi:class 3 adenylate cyclase